MRSFTDDDGAVWDAAIERESYGAYRLIFARRRGHELRHLLLDASTFETARTELEELSEPALRERLARAEPWPD